MLKQAGLRSARLCTLIVGLTCCACVPTGPPQRVERVSIGDAAFGVRYLPEDAEAARQVERVLQRAVLAAARWGRLSVPVLVTIHPTHRDLEAAAHREGHAWLRAWARHASVRRERPPEKVDLDQSADGGTGRLGCAPATGGAPTRGE